MSTRSNDLYYSALLAPGLLANCQSIERAHWLVLPVMGIVLEVFWEYSGSILAISWDYSGSILGVFWEYSGNILGLFWEYSGSVLGKISEHSVTEG